MNHFKDLISYLVYSGKKSSLIIDPRVFVPRQARNIAWTTDVIILT